MAIWLQNHVRYDMNVNYAIGFSQRYSGSENALIFSQTIVPFSLYFQFIYTRVMYYIVTKCLVLYQTVLFKCPFYL
jgi:hypothetical protein